MVLKLIFISTDVVEDTLDLASHTTLILKILSLPRWKLKQHCIMILIFDRKITGGNNSKVDSIEARRVVIAHLLS